MQYFQGRAHGGSVDIWFGVVEDREDPLSLGRVRVRVYGIHDIDKSKIPTATLPWSMVGQPANQPTISGIGKSGNGLVTGTVVYGIFLDGASAQQPFVLGAVGGAETTEDSTCKRDSNAYESFTNGFMMPAVFKSAAVDIIGQAEKTFNISWMPFAESQLSSSEPREAKVEKYLSESSKANTEDDVVWNNAFVSWAMQKGEITPPNTNSLDDWRNWGERTAVPTYGAVATVQGTKGASSRYAGFYLGQGPDGYVSILGPSNTGEPIQVKKIDPSNVLMYNMPPGYSGSTIRSYAAAVGFPNAIPPNSGVVPNGGTSNADSNDGKVSPTRAYIRSKSDYNYKYITIHCTATPKGRDIGRNEVDQMHKQRGWSEIGYHFVIRINGTVEIGRDLSKTGAHVGGHNKNNLGISLVGGVDSNNKPLEGLHNYTHAQVAALDMLLQECLDQWPDAQVLGHRDWPAVAKACPCFTVKDYMQNRSKMFKNNSSAPRDKEKGEDEKKEQKNLKEPSGGGDSSKDSSEAEPTSDNQKTYGVQTPNGKDPTGFQDPKGEYPTALSTCFNGGSNVNPLVQGTSAAGTPVYKHNQRRSTNVPMASKGAGEVVTGDAKADGPIGPLAQEDVKKYMDVMGKRESSNNYKAVNKYGYSGKYQFGAAALVDGGYVKRGTSNRGLANPGAWLGKDGINSRDDWLNNKEVQEQAMYRYTKMNYNSLVRLRVVNERSTKKHVAGSLAAAHLKGPGGARDYINNGRDNSDANGTAASSYYKMGAGSQSD